MLVSPSAGVRLGSILTLALAPCLGAQSPSSAPAPTAAPSEIVGAFDLTRGTVQDLLPRPTSQSDYEVQVVLGDQTQVLQLQAHDLRAPNFRLLIDDGVAVREAPVPPSITYRGTVQNHPESVVAATIVNGELHATVDVAGETWGIQPVTDAYPAAASAHVVYRDSDLAPSEYTCGTQSVTRVESGDEVSGGIDMVLECEIAIDLDFEFYTRNGSSTLEANNDAMRVMNGVDAIYERDLNLTYAISSMMIRTSPVSQYQNASSSSGLLSAFRSYWRSNHGGVQRDVAHLLSGKNTFGSVLGIASLGVICSNNSGYGVSWSKYTSNLVNRRGLTAHELGHNWNAGHCDSSTPCNIMCSGLGGCNNNVGLFGPASINVITNYMNSRGCITPAVQNPITLSSVQPSSVPSYSQFPAVITLTGNDLDTVQSVNIGGDTATIGTRSFNQLTFTVPAGTNIGNFNVTVTNNAGSSNGLPFSVTPTAPGVVVSIPFVTTGVPNDYTVHTGAFHNVILFMSPSPVQSALPGLVNFDIGNNFSLLFQLATLVADAGGAANLSLTVPPGIVPPLTTLYYQAITWTGTPTAPLDTTNAIGVTYF